MSRADLYSGIAHQPTYYTSPLPSLVALNDLGAVPRLSLTTVAIAPMSAVPRQRDWNPRYF